MAIANALVMAAEAAKHDLPGLWLPAGLLMTLEDQLGYTFSDPQLLKLSLTHRSVSSEDGSRHDNERLEFLGDAVLQLVITGYLYNTFTDLPEGKSGEDPGRVWSADRRWPTWRGAIGLSDHIELAMAEERTGGRDKDSIMADAMEAVIGAVYLDSGIESATDWFCVSGADRVAERAERPGLKDYKTRLQEVLARDGEGPNT